MIPEQYFASTYRIAAYVWLHCPEMRTKGMETLLQWLFWHCCNNTLAVILDEHENVVGVGVARLVMHPEDGPDDDKGDPEGSCIYVSLVVATAPGAMQMLFCMMRKRFGMRDSVAYMRDCRGPIKVRKFAALRRKVLKLKEQTL